MTKVLDEVRQQAQSLRQLSAAYLNPDAAGNIAVPETEYPIILTGMGASYHVAWNASLHLNAVGLLAFSIEASDLVFYGPFLHSTARIVIYVSQSGESAEITPILDQLSDGCQLVAVTNNRDSTLAKRAHTVLPIWAGIETTIASKTYMNSLALLWLLVRQWGGTIDGSESQQLAWLADGIEQLTSRANDLQQEWLNKLPAHKPILFLGHGPCAATARHAAMTLAEVARVSTWSASIGSFRHGFIEKVTSETRVVIFLSDGPSLESSYALARDLRSYGASVFLVSSGQLYKSGDRQPESELHEFLVPALNVIPIQLYAIALADLSGNSDGFKYISKVIDQL